MLRKPWFALLSLRLGRHVAQPNIKAYIGRCVLFDDIETGYQRGSLDPAGKRRQNTVLLGESLCPRGGLRGQVELRGIDQPRGPAVDDVIH